jgi:hypothetical protein
MVAGFVGLAGAGAWWYTFYSQVSQFLGARGALPIECIYMISGPCNMVSGAANAFGATAYDARLFWAAVGVTVIGAILGLFPGDSEDDDYRPKQGRGREPRF